MIVYAEVNSAASWRRRYQERAREADERRKVLRKQSMELKKTEQIELAKVLANMRAMAARSERGRAPQRLTPAT